MRKIIIKLGSCIETIWDQPVFPSLNAKVAKKRRRPKAKELWISVSLMEGYWISSIVHAAFSDAQSDTFL